jgi:hypothetical protein
MRNALYRRTQRTGSQLVPRLPKHRPSVRKVRIIMQEPRPAFVCVFGWGQTHLEEP